MPLLSDFTSHGGSYGPLKLGASYRWWLVGMEPWDPAIKGELLDIWYDPNHSIIAINLEGKWYQWEHIVKWELLTTSFKDGNEE